MDVRISSLNDYIPVTYFVLRKLRAAVPSHPLVKDVASKEALFDEAAVKFAVPAAVEIGA